MKSLLHILFFAAMLLPLASCGGGEKENSVDEAVEQVSEVAEDVSEAGIEAAKDLKGAVEAAVCCGGVGNCDAPAGTCCNEDGTCGGRHGKLPTMP